MKKRVCSNSVLNIWKLDSRGLPVVRFDDTAEFLFASHEPMVLWRIRFVEDIVVHADASVWAPRIVIADPGRFDVVKLVEAETHEGIQTLALKGLDPCFAHGIRLWGLEWYSDAPRAGLLLPELSELLRELRIPIMDKKARRYADILKPHVCVACLLRYPLLVRIERRRTAVHFARAEMNEYVMWSST